MPLTCIKRYILVLKTTFGLFKNDRFKQSLLYLNNIYHIAFSLHLVR